MGKGREVKKRGRERNFLPILGNLISKKKLEITGLRENTVVATRGTCTNAIHNTLSVDRVRVNTVLVRRE